MDIALVLDESWSVGRNGFEKMKTLVGDIISLFSVNSNGAHFAAVKYSSSARKVFSLAKYTDAAELQRNVREMNYFGGLTYTGEALELVQKRVYLFSFCLYIHTSLRFGPKNVNFYSYIFALLSSCMGNIYLYTGCFYQSYDL